VKVGLHDFNIIAVFLEDGAHFFRTLTRLVNDAHLPREHGEASFTVLHILEIVASKKQVGVLLLDPEESHVHRLLHYSEYFSPGSGHLVCEFEYFFRIALVRFVQEYQVKVFYICSNADGLADYDHWILRIPGQFYIKVLGSEKFPKAVVPLLDNGFHLSVERAVDSKFHSTTLKLTTS